MKTKLLSVIALVAVVGCATANLKQAEDEQRTFSTIRDSTLKAQVAYDKALQFFAENLGNSKQAIQISDKDSSHIVSNLIIYCDFKNGLGMSVPFPVTTSVDFQAKEKRIKFQIKANSVSYSVPGPLGGTSEAPIYESKIPELKICTDKLTEKFFSYIEKKDQAW